MIVLEALEEANRVHNRVVNILEIAETLPTKDRKRLEKAYANSPTKIIAKILELLRARGLVFSPESTCKRRFYGSVNVLNPDGAQAPTVQSRRGKVLNLIREVVLKLGRAVRTLDVLAHAATSEKASGLTRSDITHDLLSLEETGELTVVGRVRGDGKGLNLYLPSDMDVGWYKPKQPLTWLDEVAQTVEALWADRVEEAKAKGQRPKPITTGDVRAQIADSPFYSGRELKKDPQVLVDAVKQLSESREPLLRKIKRQGQKALLWAPVGVSNDELDFGGAYANDAERMGAAVARAVERLGRPVIVRDVKDEIERDFSLQPVGRSSVYQALQYASRETFDEYNGNGRRERIIRRVHRVGRVGGNTYYHTRDSPEARAFVEFRQLEFRWNEAGTENELGTLGRASLPWVVKGRAMLSIKEAEAFLSKLDALLKHGEMDGATQSEAEQLRESVEKNMRLACRWIDSVSVRGSDIPTNVDISVPGWTAEELLRVLKPLYPHAQNINSNAKLITVMGNSIRRIPNPNFKVRSSKDPLEATEFLFDRTDALIYAAKQWGGSECCLQAMLANSELGLLRDLRFILPALGSKVFETRLAGIACLAFLWSDEGNERLRKIALDDPEPGVRQSALWAYGFAGGEGAREMLVDKAQNDPNNRVREFASQALEADDKLWWKM
jgi:hypothetical protein